MWPFKSKKHDLISEKWLKDNKIDTNYADAFNYKKGKIKKEISRLELKMDELRENVNENGALIRKSEMEKANLEHKQQELAASKNARQSQELTRVTAEIEALIVYLDTLTNQEQQEKVEIRNTTGTVRFLKQIMYGTVLTPEELGRKPLVSDAKLVQEWRDELPRQSDVDNSDIIDSINANNQSEIDEE